MRQDRRWGESREPGGSRKRESFRASVDRAFGSVSTSFPRYRRLTVALLVAGALSGLTSIAIPGLMSTALGYTYGYGYQYNNCFDGYTYQYGSCEPPHLIVIKHVVKDNGGTANASDFTMTIHNKGDQSFPGEESPGTLKQLAVGNYYVTETGPSGYSADFSAACSGSINVDETKTCTVTNDDIPAHLIVIKHVINDNSGKAKASAFTMTINGVTATGGNSFPGAESPGTNKVVTPGNYNVTETGPAGYGTTFSADCTSTIALGQTKTCTVTNNDFSPPRTLGFWKTHQAATTALLPVLIGSYNVNTFAKATQVFTASNCSSTKPNDVIGCLAGQLLAAKLNLANNSNACIQPTVTKANTFLTGGTVTVKGITTAGIIYVGPSGTYTLSTNQRTVALALKSALDAYNNGRKTCTNV